MKKEVVIIIFAFFLISFIAAGVNAELQTSNFYEVSTSTNYTLRCPDGWVMTACEGGIVAGGIFTPNIPEADNSNCCQTSTPNTANIPIQIYCLTYTNEVAGPTGPKVRQLASEVLPSSHDDLERSRAPAKEELAAVG